MSSRRWLLRSLIALASTAVNVFILSLFYRFTSDNIRAEYFLMTPFWIIMMPVAIVTAMVFFPVIAEIASEAEARHFNQIVRMNLILFLIIASLTHVILPSLPWEDWYRLTTILLFLMATTSVIWEQIYRRLDMMN